MSLSNFKKHVSKSLLGAGLTVATLFNANAQFLRLSDALELPEKNGFITRGSVIKPGDYMITYRKEDPQTGSVTTLNLYTRDNNNNLIEPGEAVGAVYMHVRKHPIAGVSFMLKVSGGGKKVERYKSKGHMDRVLGQYVWVTDPEFKSDKPADIEKGFADIEKIMFANKRIFKRSEALPQKALSKKTLSGFKL